MRLVRNNVEIMTIVLKEPKLLLPFRSWRFEQTVITSSLEGLLFKRVAYICLLTSLKTLLELCFSQGLLRHPLYVLVTTAQEIPRLMNVWSDGIVHPLLKPMLGLHHCIVKIRSHCVDCPFWLKISVIHRYGVGKELKSRKPAPPHLCPPVGNPDSRSSAVDKLRRRRPILKLLRTREASASLVFRSSLHTPGTVPRKFSFPFLSFSFFLFLRQSRTTCLHTQRLFILFRTQGSRASGRALAEAGQRGIFLRLRRLEVGDGACCCALRVAPGFLGRSALRWPLCGTIRRFSIVGFSAEPRRERYLRSCLSIDSSQIEIVHGLKDPVR